MQLFHHFLTSRVNGRFPKRGESISPLNQLFYWERNLNFKNSYYLKASTTQSASKISIWLMQQIIARNQINENLNFPKSYVHIITCIQMKLHLKIHITYRKRSISPVNNLCKWIVFTLLFTVKTLHYSANLSIDIYLIP